MQDEQRQKTKEEIEDERQAARTVEQLLQDVGIGWSVSLNRIRPSWCKGWLETIETTPDEKIDMQYIADTWGGETIRLRILDPQGRWRGGKDFHVARAPMHHGRPLEHPEDKRERLAREERARERRNESERLNGAGSTHDSNMFSTVIDLVRSQNEASSKVYQDLAAAQTRDPMGIDDLIKFANGLKDLQGVFGGDSGGGSEDDSGMIGAFMEIMKNSNEQDKKVLEARVDALKKREAEFNRRPRQLPSGRQAPPPGPQGSNVRPINNPAQTAPGPPPAPAMDIDPETGEEMALSEELAELSAVEAAEVLGEAFTMMPIEKRQKTLKLLMALGNAGNAADIISETVTDDPDDDPLDDSSTEDDDQAAAGDAGGDDGDSSFKQVGDQ